MNLLLCAGSFDPVYGGPSVSVSRLGAELVRDGMTVGLWAQDGSAVTSTLVKKEERLLPLAGNLKQVLRSFQPDIVHDNGIWLSHNHSLARLAAHYNLPRIVSIRGMLEPWALAHKRVKKKLAWLAYQKRDLNRATALHATADSEAEVIANLGLLPRVVVLPNGVDIPAAAASHTRVPNQPRTALFLSRIHPKKGLDRLIDAWKAVRPRGWRLRIAGPGASGYCDEVARRIARAGLERQVVLEGPLYGADKTRAFTSADAFLLPSHSENFGIVVAEALAHGVPVLTTTATPWQALESEHCGWWVPSTSAAIVRGLTEVVAASDETRKAMGARGRALVKRQFAWRAIAKNMRAAYESIVEQSRVMGKA